MTPFRQASKDHRQVPRAGAAYASSYSAPPSPAYSHGKWRHRLHIAFNIFLAIVVLATVSVLGYVRYQYGRVHGIDMGASLEKYAGPSSPMNVLLVGSDTRATATGQDAKSFGKNLVDGQRSDTVMLLHVDPKGQRAAMLSIPRDTWVTIAGTNGRKDKINAAFQSGPQQLAQTISNNFRIPIHHYLQVDFESFKDIVNALGGVNVPFPAPARDWGLNEATGAYGNLSGLDIPNAGCIRLDGKMALSYVRSRHYEIKERGRWIPDPQSDLGRIQRQQDFMRRVMRKASSQAKNPITANQLVDSVVKNTSMDKGFSLRDMQQLALRFRSLDPSSVQMMTLPTQDANLAGVSALAPSEPQATATIKRFLYGDDPAAADKTSGISTGSISVRVLNGSGAEMQATQVSSDLRKAGFVVSGIGDSAISYATTTIRYPKGQQDNAIFLSKYLQGNVNIVQDNSVVGVAAVLITGTSYQGFNREGTSPGAAAPTTTTASTTTTAPAAAAPPTTASPFLPAQDPNC